jgi:DNA-directed RNA polymerase specialized sigma subunit
MLGKVTVWYMSEEERLAYIAKHPIKPSDKPQGVTFDTDAIDHKKVQERKKEALVSRVTIMDNVDKDVLHKLFMSGMRVEDIAKSLKITVANLYSYIKKQRELDPDKWPYRLKKRGVDS